MKNLALLLVVSLSFIATAQETVKASIWQDNKFNRVNILTKIKLTGHQQSHGFMTASPMFEYAELKGSIYRRYAVDVGYTFNRLFEERLEFTPSINYGIQDRWKKSWLVFGADFELSYALTDTLSLSLLAQFVERKDLKWAYDDYLIRFSGFIGITIDI